MLGQMSDFGRNQSNTQRLIPTRSSLSQLPNLDRLDLWKSGFFGLSFWVREPLPNVRKKCNYCPAKRYDIVKRRPAMRCAPKFCKLKKNEEKRKYEPNIFKQKIHWGSSVFLSNVCFWPRTVNRQRPQPKASATVRPSMPE